MKTALFAVLHDHSATYIAHTTIQHCGRVYSTVIYAALWSHKLFCMANIALFFILIFTVYRSLKCLVGASHCITIFCGCLTVWVINYKTILQCGTPYGCSNWKEFQAQLGIKEKKAGNKEQLKSCETREVALSTYIHCTSRHLIPNSGSSLLLLVI